MKFSLAVLITLTLVTVTAVGQNLTPIVDLNSPVDAAANASASLSMDAPDRAVDGQGDRYYQMQVLQEEAKLWRSSLCTLVASLPPSALVSLAAAAFRNPVQSVRALLFFGEGSHFVLYIPGTV